MNTKIMIFGFFFVSLLVITTTGKLGMHVIISKSIIELSSGNNYVIQYNFTNLGNQFQQTNAQGEIKYSWEIDDNDDSCWWSSWSAVGGCSTNCGTGVQRYTRQSKGYSCWGSSEKTETCVSHYCQGTFYN